MRQQDLSRFWHDVVYDADIVQLSEEDLLVSQEELNSALDTYWVRLPRSSKRVGPLNAPVMEPEESTLEPDEHPVARPLASERPMDDLDATLVTEEEDESQCSVGLYENGTGPPSVSRSDVLSAPSPLPVGADGQVNSEPSFTNCLTKTVDPDKGELTFVHPSADHQTAATGSTEESAEGAGSKAESDSSKEVANPAVVAPAEETSMPPLPEASVERKVIHPRNRLPVAVLKPENPRAIRYWLDQRRSVRPSPKLDSTGSDRPVPERKLTVEDTELFHGERELGVHDPLGQRVLQVCRLDPLFPDDALISSSSTGPQHCPEFEF